MGRREAPRRLRTACRPELIPVASRGLGLTATSRSCDVASPRAASCRRAACAAGPRRSAGPALRSLPLPRRRSQQLELERVLSDLERVARLQDLPAAGDCLPASSAVSRVNLWYIRCCAAHPDARLFRRQVRVVDAHAAACAPAPILDRLAADRGTRCPASLPRARDQPAHRHADVFLRPSPCSRRRPRRARPSLRDLRAHDFSRWSAGIDVAATRGLRFFMKTNAPAPSTIAPPTSA